MAKPLGILAAVVLSLALVTSASARKPAWAGHPKPSPSASPAPTVTDWTIAFVTYRTTDADCQGHHILTSLSDAELVEAQDIQRSMVALVNSWNPNLRLVPTFIVRATLLTLSPYGTTRCWPSPSDVPSAGSFDSQYVMVDPRDPTTNDWWYGAAGLSYTSGTYPYGGGYSTSVAVGFSFEWRRNVAINEWLHPTTAWFRERGAYVPDPEDDVRYGYTDQMAFMAALVGGTLLDLSGDGHPDGITPWHLSVAGTPF